MSWARGSSGIRQNSGFLANSATQFSPRTYLVAPVVPRQARGEVGGGVFQVDDAAMAGNFRGGGGMQDQRAHRDDAAAADRADHLGDAGLPLVELVVEPAEAVGAGKDAQGAVLRAAIIEVDPDRDH